MQESLELVGSLGTGYIEAGSLIIDEIEAGME